MQLSVLNENLGTTRSDLLTTQQQNTEITKQLDDLSGDKLGEFLFCISLFKFWTIGEL